MEIPHRRRRKRPCQPDDKATACDRYAEGVVATFAAAHTLTCSIAAKGLPFFVSSLQNTWTVRPDGPSRSIVDVEIQAVTKGLIGAIGAIPMGRMLGKGAVGLPADLKTHLEHDGRSVL